MKSKFGNLDFLQGKSTKKLGVNFLGWRWKLPISIARNSVFIRE